MCATRGTCAALMRFLGVDLAWGEGTPKKPPNDTGVAALNEAGDLLDAGWTVGLDETAEWIDEQADKDTLLFIDAPLIVENTTGQRPCDRQVGQCYVRIPRQAEHRFHAKPNRHSTASRTAIPREGEQ